MIAVASAICCSCSEAMTPDTFAAAAVDAEPDHVTGENK
jgi:hypothetical protein